MTKLPRNHAMNVLVGRIIVYLGDCAVAWNVLCLDCEVVGGDHDVLALAHEVIHLHSDNIGSFCMSDCQRRCSQCELDLLKAIRTL